MQNGGKSTKGILGPFPERLGKPYLKVLNLRTESGNFMYPAAFHHLSGDLAPLRLHLRSNRGLKKSQNPTVYCNKRSVIFIIMARKRIKTVVKIEYVYISVVRRGSNLVLTRISYLSASSCQRTLLRRDGNHC